MFRSVLGSMEKVEQPLERALNGVKNQELQATIRRHMKRMNDVLFYSVILRAPALWIPALFIALFYVVAAIFTKKKPKSQFRKVQSKVSKNIQADILMEANIYMRHRRRAFG